MPDKWLKYEEAMPPYVQHSFIKCQHCREENGPLYNNDWCTIRCRACRETILNPSHGRSCWEFDECDWKPSIHDETHDVTQCAKCERKMCLSCPDYNVVWCDHLMDHHCIDCE